MSSEKVQWQGCHQAWGRATKLRRSCTHWECERGREPSDVFKYVFTSLNNHAAGVIKKNQNAAHLKREKPPSACHIPPASSIDDAENQVHCKRKCYLVHYLRADTKVGFGFESQWTRNWHIHESRMRNILQLAWPFQCVTVIVIIKGKMRGLL